MLPSRKLRTGNHLWSPRWTQCRRHWSCTPIAWQGEVAIRRINRTLPDVPTGAPHVRSFPENLPTTEAQGKAGTWTSSTEGSRGGAAGSRDGSVGRSDASQMSLRMASSLSHCQGPAPMSRAGNREQQCECRPCPTP